MDLFFYKCVKRARKAKGLSQSELGEILDVPQGRISGWESGKHGISEAVLLDLADALDITVLELVSYGYEDLS